MKPPPLPIEDVEVEIVSPGARTSVERATRGQAHLGVSVGGPFDERAAVRANRLVGNRDDAAVLECVLVGPTLRVHCAAHAHLAIAGAPFDGCESGVHALRNGDTLRVGACARGLRASIAVRGGFAGAAGVVAKGQRIVSANDVALRVRRPPAWELPTQDNRAVLRVTDGPLSSLRDASFLLRTFRVSPMSDRAGIRLEPLPASSAATADPVGAPWCAADVVTTGVAVGAVQLLPSGLPVILGVDRATTGGYPVIAHVASIDRWMLGQLRPGATVRFAHVSFARARALWRDSDMIPA